MLPVKCKILFYLVKWFKKRNRTDGKKNCQWQSCLLTDREKMIKLNRRPSMDVSYQSSVLWPSGFRGKDSNVKSWQTTDAKWWQHAILARWAKKMSITLEKTEGSRKDAQFRNTDNIGYKTENKDILAIK